MFCKKCGAEIQSGSRFCTNCGATFEDVSGYEEDAEKTVRDAKKQKKKLGFLKTTRSKIWFAVIMIWTVLLASIAIFLIKSFPLEISFRSETSLTTSSGTIEDFEVKIKSNQPLKKVYYAVDPKDSEDIKAYTEIKSNGVYKRNITIPQINLPPGETKMYICATTLFGGKEFHEIELVFDIGYISAPDPDKIIEYEEGHKIVSNEIVIVVKDGTEPEEVEELVKDYDGEVVGAIYPINQYQIRFSGSGTSYIDEKVAEIEGNDIVESAMYNAVYEAKSDVFPDDSEYDSWTDDKTNPDGNNWGLECIDAPKAWEYNDQMQVVKVGVIDSFLDCDHEDLQIEEDRFMFMRSEDFSDPDELWEYYADAKSWHSCSDDNCATCSSFVDHGSHVSGIIGAVNDNKGVCGVNWNTDLIFASLWHLREGADGSLYKYDTTMSFNMAFTHCVLSDCRVINMSFGTGPTTVTEEEIIENQVFDNMVADFESRGYDFVICKAAGNDNVDASLCQMTRKLTSGEHARAHTIIVGAIGNYPNKYEDYDSTYFNKASFSNYGEAVDIMAPGVDIHSTICDDQYESWPGTSMASPMVAGAVSMIYSLNPNLSYDYVKTLICNANDSLCYHDGITYPVLDIGKAVEFAVENDWDEIDTRKFPENPPLGYIHGTISDAETGDAILDATLICTKEDGTVYRAETYDGLYQCQLPAGTYDMEFSSEGYITETVYDVEVATDIITYNVRLNMVRDEDETGRANGYVIDAFDASKIANASIKVYRGLNCISGDAVETLTADSNGYYSLELSPGNYTVVATASGYQQGYANIIILPNQTKSSQNCVLTPVLKDGEIRVVLSWGANPYDLDSHMVGPAPSGRFHTYYSNKNYYYQNRTYCNLDVDDINSYGPETTSVYVGVDGTYTFYVHDFSNRASNSSSSMATSGAQVKVYVAGENAPKVFNVPNKQGTLWKVCSIKNGVITPINEVSYHSTVEDIGSGQSVN